MGNSVYDFKGGKDYLYRDRLDSSVSSPVYATQWYGSKPISPTGNKYAAGSLARCVDVSHPNFHSFMRHVHRLDRGSETYKKLASLDVGDSFAKESISVSMPRHVQMQKGQAPLQSGYYGPAFPSGAYANVMQDLARGVFPTIPDTLGIDRLSLAGLGSTAVARSLPDIPEFSLFRFVGELRAGLPKIPLKVLAKEKKLRDTGGEYLNYQFGIAPLIGDLQKFIQQLQDPKFRASVQASLDQEFRIRKVLEKGTTSERRDLASNEMATFPGSGGAGYQKTTSSFRIWSSCSFVYYQLTELDRLLAEMDRMTGGLGVLPTSIDIWNLVPWSWLIDWFTNFNHVLTNVSFLGRDGLYFRRGYIMATYTHEVETFRTGVAYGTAFDTIGRIKSDRKYRVKASPFGFGYTWKDFDPFQLSILGALGVNRLRF